MKNILKISAGMVAALLISLVCFAYRAEADVNDFSVTNFDAQYSLSREDPQGKLRITEAITVNFTDNNHGILRALPLKYKGDLNTKVIAVEREAGEDWPYTTYKESDNLIVKIGDPNVTVTGSQTYIITYEVENVITFYGDHDELYLDINGDQWQQPFEKLSATVNLPGGLISSGAACFTGKYGTTDEECVIDVEEELSRVQVATTQPLGPRETLTIVLSFDKGFFRQPTRLDWLKEHLGVVLAGVLLPVLSGTWAYRYWSKHGRDHKGRSTIIAEYGPPKGLTPAEVGTIFDYRVDNRDISATIINLAIRKYIRIIESSKKKMFKDSKEYSFELLTPDFSQLKPHEQEILNGLFAQPSAGAQVELKDLKNDFYQTVSRVQADLVESLTKGGYFEQNPSKAGRNVAIIGVILLVLAGLLHSAWSIGPALGGLIVLTFSGLMTRRSQHGQLVKDEIEGLKLYLKVAEADRMHKLHSPNAPYRAKSTEPKRTVELFEKLLPYAVLLGVEKDWAKQFEHIYTTPPDWYSGNWHTFNAVYFASHLSGSVGAMGTNFSPPSSSGSSGMGGGFSGGGGGGGGGGGW